MGLTGPAGAQGPAGDKGPTGEQGPPYPTGIIENFPEPVIFFEVLSPEVEVPPEAVGSATATCPAGTVPSGTGFDAGIGRVRFVMRFGRSVGIGVVNERSVTIRIRAQAICTRGGFPAGNRGATLTAADFREALAGLKN